MTASDAAAPSRELVLIGGGHSHVAVLKSFGMRPEPGVRVTLICRDSHTPYSGMLPGFVAGHYDFDEAHIDLRPLCIFAGARFVHDEAIGIDTAARRVICGDRPPVPYDVLSLNIGSTPSTADASGADVHSVPVKPINGFLAHWDRLVQRVLAHDDVRSLHICSVGSGAGGVEILLTVQYRLTALLAAAGRSAGHLRFHLFSDTPIILPTHNASTRAKFMRVLAERAVALHLGQAVVGVERDSVRLADGTGMPMDVVLWVTAAGAPGWLADTGLQRDGRGFIAVRDSLQSVSHDGVFAVGDIASVLEHPRPKSGVFAVRQGPPLADNLRRVLCGAKPMAFRPQQKFLSIITTGEKHAIASRGSWSAEGDWVWRWKDLIDRRFMAKYNDLPDMGSRATAAAGGMGVAPDAAAMRCGGCGAKVGGDVLRKALNRLAPVKRPEVMIGLEQPDDAAVIQPPPGKLLVHTADQFRAFIDDPYVFGAVAAQHALSDIYAMGAEPFTALAMAALPYADEARLEDDLYQMMAGAIRVLNSANAALVGGHTSEGAEMSLGFAVSGVVERERLFTKSGLQPGDCLLLTKPLGTGALFAAHMRAKAKGRWIDAALDHMLQSNGPAAICLRAHGARACTDVTGFGLIGHALEMAAVDGLTIELDLDAVPLLDGARDCVAAGIVSSLQPQNLRLARSVWSAEAAADNPAYALLFDPQTSGGLLAGVPAANARSCVDALRQLGYAAACAVASVVGSSGSAAIRLKV
ncbi:MAG TPA: selenide, water dikinase SelD [Candidatus Cybelea sp.]|nr:selenide, water dikinase SelD [Candidatus Cybelea sp.]